MFKGIIPSKRMDSTEFTMLTTTTDEPASGKENVREPMRPTNRAANGAKANKGKAVNKQTDEPREVVAMNQAFDKLLDDLQIPNTLRPKLATMESTVKAAMLKSSQVMVSQRPASPPATPGTIRRTRSSDSLGSPSPSLHRRTESSQTTGRTAGALFTSTRPSHSRGRSYSNLRAGTPSGPPSPTKRSSSKNFSPSNMVSALQGTSSTQIDLETVKKLRLLLRNESATWTEDFLTHGGYSAMLTRLIEILEVEWRDEQHDDQLLHELLRCFKALSTSSIGCFALRSSAPTPFVQLIALLYSDKKPGDVGTRQVMVELILNLFDLYPLSALPASSGRSSERRREAWDTDDSPRSGIISLPTPHKTVFAFIRALLLTPAPAPSESPANPVNPHAFIENLHKPRIYKTYLQELSDVCRDYFWVFCHPNNTIWSLEDTDEAKVEKPRAPGGMTGGVEFEAMAYMTTHFKLINAIAKSVEDLKLPKDNESSAHQFHVDLFLSGFERILLIARKASTTYYPTLHLEIARYVAFAYRARFDVPWTVSRLIGLPPTGLTRPVNEVRPARILPIEAPVSSKMLTPAGPGPTFPQPRKVTPMMFDA